MGMHTMIGSAASQRTRQVDLMIGNFHDRPSMLFKQLDSLLHTIGKCWRSDASGEMRLLLRDSLPGWQHEGAQAIATRLAEELGDTFPRLQVGRCHAHGSSQVEAEQHAWKASSWLASSLNKISPAPLSRKRESMSNSGSASLPWCECDFDRVTDWDDDEFSPTEDFVNWMKKLHDICDEWN